jgi:PTS system fructose-specific IIC component
VEGLRKIRQYLLTGVSYAIPFVACGGILIALAIALSPMNEGSGPDIGAAPTWVQLIMKIGVAAFSLLLPILAGYISYAIAGRPGLVAGFVGGFLCNDVSLGGDTGPVSAGFLGAIAAGLLAGYVVNLIKSVTVPRWLKPIMPILVIPIVSAVVVGAIMVLVLGPPIAGLNEYLKAWLEQMGTGNAIVLAMILGAMIAFDMGGPVNKAAFFFGAAMIQEGNYLVMGACAAAICTPPLGMGLATLLRRSTWREEEREAGIAALAMGMIGITEGAIPFAASDPLRVIPSIMAGSMVAAVTAMLGKVGDHAPHGGPIVLPVVDNKLMYIVAIVAGTVVTALMITLLRARREPVTAGQPVEAGAEAQVA